MKKIATLVILLSAFTIGGHAQKLSKDEVARYESEIKTMINYLEETVNFIGDSTTSAREKEIVFSESWSKIFIDDKVQVEDDLDNNRKSPINKDVQAYLKDIDFFFKYAQFKFDLQSIANSTRDDGSIYFKVTMTRQLWAKTINDERIDNVKNRFVEINLDRQKNSLKIASIYTSKINEKEVLRNWWNNLSENWKNRLGEGISLYDSIPIKNVGMISATDFVCFYNAINPETGEAELKDRIMKNDMDELDAKLKAITQRQHVDMSGLREIITLEPLDELPDLISLNISGTSIDDISPLRNANKLKTLNANSTLIEDISPLKYSYTLEELEVANTTISDLSVLSSLRNLTKLNVANTSVSRITQLKNCPKLLTLNISGIKVSNIAPLQDLTQLKNLDISYTLVRDLSPLGELKNLNTLNISGTSVSDLQALESSENLRELMCSNTSISDLSPLKNNRRLNKIYCDHSNIGNAEASAFTIDNPFTLVIYDTESLVKWWNDLPLYWKAVFSKQINIKSEPTTEQLHQIINMQELDLSGNPYMQNLMPVSRLTNLKKLNIAHTEITHLQAIQGLANLETLNLQGTFINDLTPLHEMTNLKELDITNTPITNLMPLANDKSIETIFADSTAIEKQNVVALKTQQRQVTVVYQTEQLKTWWSQIDEIWKVILRQNVSVSADEPDPINLQRIVDLRELNIGTETPIISLYPLTDFIWLESLTISNQSIHDIEPLANKEHLRELDMQNTPVSNLKPIENSLKLEYLNIENTQVSNLAPLSKMNNLVTLNAGGTLVKSLKPLSGLQKLENLFVNNTDIKSLTPIENIASLRQLKIYNTKVKSKAVESLQQKRLDLNIIYY